MFRQVFDPENLFWSLMARGVDFVGLGLFWLLLCVPVITVGPATAALYYTVVKVFRQKDTYGFRTMWRAFRTNLKKGCAATAICLPLAAVFSYFYYVMSLAKGTGTLGAAMFVAYWVALLLPGGVFCWLWPVMARFESGLKQTFQTSFLLAMRHLPTTFVLVLLYLQLIIFCLEQWWPVLFVPVLAVLLASLFQEKIFLKYLDEDQQAALKGETDGEDEYEE